MAEAILEKESLLFVVRVLAMALSGLWYGASQYITSVECPARYETIKLLKIFDKIKIYLG